MKKPSNHQLRLVETAAHLFQRQGYHGTGVTQLLDESGAPKGSFYYHFPGGKEEVATFAVEQAGAYIANMARVTASSATSCSLAIDAFADQLAQWFKKSGYSAGCPVTAVLLDTTPESALTLAACKTAFDSWVAVWHDRFNKEGIGKSTSAELATFWVMSLEGAWLLARARQNIVPFKTAAKMMNSLYTFHASTHDL